MHCLVSSIGFPTNISSANPGFEFNSWQTQTKFFLPSFWLCFLKSALVLSSERYSFSGEGRAFHIHPFLEKKEKDVSVSLYWLIQIEAINLPPFPPSSLYIYTHTLYNFYLQKCNNKKHTHVLCPKSYLYTYDFWAIYTYGPQGAH